MEESLRQLLMIGSIISAGGFFVGLEFGYFLGNNQISPYACKLITRNYSYHFKESLLIVGGVIAMIAMVLFAYLMWYVSPDEHTERVKVIAVTEVGCIAKTYDSFAVNIGDCQVQQGEYVNTVIDKKLKERAAMMNPTS